MSKRKNIAVLFSGGADSSATAVHYLKEGYFVHLLTFDNGAERGFDRARERGAAIEKIFPSRCIWRLLDSKPLFHTLAVKSLEKDVKKYGNLVCCGCKLAMLAEAIIYCTRNRIAELADGFKEEQAYYPEQTPDYIGPADAFAREFGISYLHPFFPPHALSDRIAALSAAVPGAPAQASCLFGENPVEDRSFIGGYVRSKLPVMRRYLQHALE